MYTKKAEYLIDDARFYAAGIASSWDYDNRVVSDKNDVFPPFLTDKKSGAGMRYKHDFQPRSEGFLRLELLFLTEGNADGAHVKLASSDDRTAWELVTRDGFFVLNGEKTDAPSSVGEVRLRVDMDLNSRNATLVVRGQTVASFRMGEVNDVSRLFVGTTGETEIKLTPLKTRLCADFLAQETFLCTDGAFPDTIALNGDFEVRRHDGANLQMNYTYAAARGQKGRANTALVPLTRQASDILSEVYLLLPDGADGARVSLMNADTEVFGVYTKNCAFYAAGGTLLRRFTPNVWQLVRFETRDGRVTVKIDGKVCGVFSIEKLPLDGIQVYFSPDREAELYFTDILCEANVVFPDYCPEPKAVRHSEYDIGVNVCNMWREGHHFGWDRITYFKDNLPLIGPYDEGNPEVADWEIKFMTEHGITFQHFCWYCPDPVIDFPIKRSRMDNALRDGFMNARYSDKMKFIIMWENGGYQNTNPEHFKEYVWKYWCEYFFTDPRYLKIDNKPLVSLWSFKFVEHWGGEQKAKEIIAFMNEDIKRYGCDGILLMATAGMSKYENLSEYCDVTYSYHFGKEGCSADYQIESIRALNAKVEEGLVPYLQTVSVGFNACPWHGAEARVPLITPEDYEKVLRYTKSVSDAVTDKKWYNRIFMMSTWNEYGEGTYIMPSNLHGFGYLDKIRAVFVPESGKAENLLPDENQQKRITTLRFPNRSVIRRLGYQPSEVFKKPNTLVRTDDFSTESAVWQSYHDTLKISYTGTHIRLSSSGTHDHYSLVAWGGEKGLFPAKSVSGIRIYVRAERMAAIRFAFLTDTDKRWANNKCEKTYKISPSDEFVPLDFCPGRFPTWSGMITDIRFDNMEQGEWEISKIEYSVYRNDASPVPKVFVNGAVQDFDFDPKPSDGDLLVSLDPGRGIFRALKLYHEYDGAAHRLYMASLDTEVVWEEESAAAYVNGRRCAMSEPLRMRDGLPTVKLGELCAIFGYRYTFDGRQMRIEV